jgi:hypothetical protein
MKQTAKYCEECSGEFSSLPVYVQNDKQKEFLKTGNFTMGSHVDYEKIIKTETGTCEGCGQVKVVSFYLL